MDEVKESLDAIRKNQLIAVAKALGHDCKKLEKWTQNTPKEKVTEIIMGLLQDKLRKSRN